MTQPRSTSGVSASSRLAAGVRGVLGAPGAQSSTAPGGPTSHRAVLRADVDDHDRRLVVDVITEIEPAEEHAAPFA